MTSKTKKETQAQTEKTPEEKVLERLNYDVPVATEEKAALREEQAAFNGNFRTNPGYAATWNLEAVLEAEAKLKIAALLRPTRRTPMNEVRKRAEHWVSQYRRGMSHRSGAHRSTSQPSNLVEDVQRQVGDKLYAKLDAALRGEWAS